MTERKLKPHIRFKGFENNWKKVKMSQLVDERSENVVPDNQYPLMAFIAEKGVSDKGEKYNRDFLVKSEKKKYKKTEYGDLIYSSNNLEVGSIGINNYGNATISPVYSIFKVNKLMTYTFLGYLVQRKSFINNMIKYRQGVTYGQWKIHESDFLRLQEIIPNSKEQQKIGDLFAKLDRLLDMQQQKLDQLELLKKALLQKLFPKQDAKIPELRFKGFEEEWVRTRIKNIVQYSSSSFSISELKENNEGNTYPVYDATGTKYYSKKFDMHDDYIAIIKDGSNVGKTRLLPAKTSVLSTMGYLQALNSNILFDFYSITNTNFDKYKVGSGIPHIYFSDYKKECKLVPKISEQQKIGNLLAKVDRLIELENKKFSILKLVKKSLLQNMFVE